MRLGDPSRGWHSTLTSHHRANRQLACRKKPTTSGQRRCRKPGATVEEGPDWITVHPLPKDSWKAASARTSTCPRRVTVAYAVSARSRNSVPTDQIPRSHRRDPKCVAKTFPDYFEALFPVGAQPCPRPISVIGLASRWPHRPRSQGTSTAVAAGFGLPLPRDSGALYHASRQQPMPLLKAGLRRIEPNDRSTRCQTSSPAPCPLWL